jgi:hypothetical protein
VRCFEGMVGTTSTMLSARPEVAVFAIWEEPPGSRVERIRDQSIGLIHPRIRVAFS